MAADNKTTVTDQDVAQFLNTIEDEQKRQDSFALVDLMKQVTGEEPKMWGSAIIGFGSHHYKYDSGREGDTMIAGFSPRKAALTIYNMGGIDADSALFKQLGKYTTGKGCLYIKRLSDVNTETLKSLIAEQVRLKTQA